MVTRGSRLLPIGVVLSLVIANHIASTVAADEQRPSPDIEAMVGRLDRLKHGAETDAAVAALARRGDEAVTEIGRQLTAGDPGFGMRHRAVLVLKEVNSENARELLRRMALGELSGGNPNTEGWAAQAFIACDPSAAGTLLTSAAHQVLIPALDAVEEEPIDEERLALLKACLANEEAVVSWRAATVMTGGSTGEFAVEAVNAIAEAMTAVAGNPIANTPYPRAGGATFVEMYCAPYFRSLVVARVDNQVLHQLVGRMQGRAREGVILALAERGDASVHEGVVKLAQDPEAGLFRAWAVLALEQIGTREDLPLLRKLARTDPLVREEWDCTRPDGRGIAYPVREAAERTIRTFKIKFKGNTSDEMVIVVGVSVAAIAAWFAVRFINRWKRPTLTVKNSICLRMI